jgi:hypothetical protein
LVLVHWRRLLEVNSPLRRRFRQNHFGDKNDAHPISRLAATIALILSSVDSAYQFHDLGTNHDSEQHLKDHHGQLEANRYFCQQRCQNYGRQYPKYGVSG